MKAVVLTVLLACALSGRAQQVIGPIGTVRWDETDLQLTVSGVISSAIPAVIADGNIYISASDLLQLLKIRVDSVRDEGYLRGFFIEESRPYEIDARAGIARLNDEYIPLKREQVIFTDERLYLRADVFDRLFGMHSRFNFRAMEVMITTDVDLPIVRALKRERMYAEMRRGTELEKFDAAVPRSMSLARGAMLDWSVSLNAAATTRPQFSYTITPAMQLAGGDAELIYNTAAQGEAGSKGPQWRWHYADDESEFLRQITIGTGVDLPYSPHTLAPLAAQLTNHSTVRRVSYGTYSIDDTTSPGWTVELWVNRQLVDMTRADNLGRYSFSIPMSFGATEVVVKSYGPWGEEHATQHTVQIPYSFLRPGELEYSVAAAYTRQTTHEPFSVGTLTYGINDAMTVSTGLSYAPTGDLKWFTPFASLSARPLPDVLMSAEYADAVKAGVSASYALPFSGSLNASWFKYHENVLQGTDEKEELQASLSTPVTVNKIRSTFSLRGSIQTEYGFVQRHAESALSGASGGYTFGASLIADWYSTQSGLQSLRTSVSLSTPPFRSVAIRPMIEYDFATMLIARTSLYLDLSTWGYNTTSIGVEYAGANKSTTIRAAFRLDLPFSSSTATIDRSTEGLGAGVSSHGTIGWDASTHEVLSDNHAWARTGGITFQPFLDLNNNGVRDANETFVGHIDVRTSGGRILESEGDSVTRITDLEPYRRYVLHVSGAGFENIAWRPKYNSYGVVVEPNQFLRMEIPVIIAGEVVGGVVRLKDGVRKGMSGVCVRFLDEHGNVVDSTFTMTDGSFDFLGLPAGKYTARIDQAQLDHLGLRVNGGYTFTLRALREGDVVDNLEFVAEPKMR